MFAWGRDGWIGEARDHHIDVGALGKFTVLGLIVGALHIFDAGGDRHCAAEVAACAWQARKFRQAIEREIYFAGGAAIFVAADFFDEIFGEILGVHHFQ